MASLSSTNPLAYQLDVLSHVGYSCLYVYNNHEHTMNREKSFVLSNKIEKKIKQIIKVVRKDEKTFVSEKELSSRKIEILHMVEEMQKLLDEAKKDVLHLNLEERNEFDQAIHTAKMIQEFAKVAVRDESGKKTEAEGVSHSPTLVSRAPARKADRELPEYRLFDQWNRMRNYWEEYFKKHPDIDFETQEALAFHGLRYSSAMAHLRGSSAEMQRRDTNPLQDSDKPDYHREYEEDNPILLELERSIKSEINYREEGTFLLINSRRFKQELKQSYDYYNLVLGLDDDTEMARKTIQEALKNLQLENLEDLIIDFEKRIFFRMDIPKTDSNAEIGPIFKRQRNLIQGVIKEEIQKFCDQKGWGDPLYRNLLSDKISMGSFINIKGQEVFMSKCSKKSDEENVRKLIKNAGFTPTLQQSLRMLSKFHSEDIEGIFPGIRGAKLEPALTSVRTLSQLIDHPSYQAFKRTFSGRSSFSFLANSLCLLIEGCSHYRLEENFAKRRIHDALYDSFGRIIQFMEKALSLYGKGLKVSTERDNLFELAFEEILLWLSIAQPYSNGSFERRIAEAASSHSHIPPQHVRFTHSGTRTISEIFSVVSKMSHAAHQSNRTLLFNDCYWEIFESMQEMKSSKKRNQTIVVNTQGDDFREKIRGLQEKKEKIDLFFIDFHSSFSEKNLTYKKNDVKAAIKELLDSGVAERPLTVAIDTTIGCFIQSDEVDDLLIAYKEQIDSGELNIITYKSHQKFDSFGTDKVGGGSYCVYSGNPNYIKEFRKLDKAKRGKESDQPDLLNYQALAHIYHSTLPALEEYKRRIFANADYVYQRINPAFKCDPRVGFDKLISLATKPDDHMHCLSIYIPNTEYSLFMGNLKRRFVDAELPISFRSSYGYRTATWTDVEPCIRFSIGIEDRENLDKMVKILNEEIGRINAKLIELMKPQSTHVYSIMSGFRTSITKMDK